MYDQIATAIAWERIADLHREADRARRARRARAVWRRHRAGGRHYSPPTPSPRSV